MSMFCFQCQETARNQGCTVKGVCGKESQTAALMDLLLYVGRGVAIVQKSLRDKGIAADVPDHFLMDALFCTITNANFDDSAISERIDKALELKKELLRKAAENGVDVPDMPEVKIQAEAVDYLTKADSVGVLSEADEDKRSLKQLTIYGLKGMAAYA
ncbi:MAG: hydroxylamine reductase, partial [Bacteroidales bacterium]|nr:hydroxylamine reductase [Bacteroidales bacterium]